MSESAATKGMDGVPRDVLRAAYQRKPIYLLKIPCAFAAWGGLVWLLYATQHHRFAIAIGCAVSLMVAYLIRGLGAAAHDSVHGNISRSKLISYWVGVLCWSPTGMSYTIYGNYHLHHHRIANTYPDIDNFVVSDYTRSPFLARVLVMLVFTVGYPFYFLFRLLRYIKRLSMWHRVRMNLELAAIFSIVGAAYVIMPLQVFLFFYGLPFLLGAFLASTSQMIEHFEMPEGDDDAYSSRTYGTENKLTNFVWNNVMFHNEHHKYPGIPFYNLASFHHAAYPHYDERVKAAVSPHLFRTALRLWWRILTMDMKPYLERYDTVDKQAERERLMTVAGISSEPVVAA